MQTIQEIAKSVDRSRFNRKHEPGKAQQVILDALGIEAECFGHANAIFEALGFTVTAVRKGRKSVPEVRTGALEGGAFNQYGEGEYWNLTPDVDLSAIQEWIVE